MSKDFLTYNQQMKYLRDKKGIECNGTSNKIALCKMGYFNLINGYKNPFVSGMKSGSHIYIKGTSLEQICKVKEFDDSLRMLLLEYITKIEEEIRTLVGYKFDEANGNGKIGWYNVEAFSPNVSAQDIVKVISDAYHQVQQSKQSYIQHYFDNHKYIPTWILIKVIKFSTLIELIDISKNSVKDGLCDLFNIYDKSGYRDYKFLIASLHWMRKVRNSCAHNERIFGMQRIKGRLVDSKYFSLLSRSYTRERKQMLIDLLIYMRYYLDDKDYKKLIGTIKGLLIKLEKDINTVAFDKVRADMGIKRVSDLDILISTKKKIEYNKF